MVIHLFYEIGKTFPKKNVLSHIWKNFKVTDVL